MRTAFFALCRRGTALGVLFFGAVAPSSAIVNIEDVRVEVKPGFSGQVAFSATGQLGNTDQRNLSLGTRVQWHRETATDFIVLNYDRGETADVVDTDKAFLHARHIGHITDRRAWEAFGQIEQNEFTRLSYRGSIGGGLRWIVFKDAGERTSVTVGSGAFYSRERLEPLAGTTDAGVETLWRANFYVAAKHHINDNVRIASTTYYQPALRDAGDFRALEQLALLIKLTDRLDLRLSLDVAHDSRPPQLVEKTDVTYRTGIEYAF